ncbi:MAG: hypothetical protein WCW13_04045 [archaeon]|jgi:hypothetical protein
MAKKKTKKIVKKQSKKKVVNLKKTSRGPSNKNKKSKIKKILKFLASIRKRK